jgi:hypothetical protein
MPVILVDTWHAHEGISTAAISPRPLYGLSLFLALAKIVEAFGITSLCILGSGRLCVCAFGGRWIVLQISPGRGLMLPVFVPCYGLELSPVTQQASATQSASVRQILEFVESQQAVSFNPPCFTVR